MQWLIDILAAKVIAEIGVPPCFIPRADLIGPDFQTGDFITDNAWHELDLSAIVPPQATAVTIKCIAMCHIIESHWAFERGGYSNHFQRYDFYTAYADFLDGVSAVVPLSDTRTINYLFENIDWTYIVLNVIGWWL